MAGAAKGMMHNARPNLCTDQVFYATLQHRSVLEAYISSTSSVLLQGAVNNTQASSIASCPWKFRLSKVYIPHPAF